MQTVARRIAPRIFHSPIKALLHARVPALPLPIHPRRVRVSGAPPGTLASSVVVLSR